MSPVLQRHLQALDGSDHLGGVNAHQSLKICLPPGLAEGKKSDLSGTPNGTKTQNNQLLQRCGFAADPARRSVNKIFFLIAVNLVISLKS